MKTIHTNHKGISLDITVVSSNEMFISAGINDSRYVSFEIDFFIQNLRADNDNEDYFRVQTERIDTRGDYCVEDTMEDLCVSSWEYDDTDLILCVQQAIFKVLEIERYAEDRAAERR